MYTLTIVYDLVQENPCFLRKPNPLCFGSFIGFLALLGFRIFLFQRAD